MKLSLKNPELSSKYFTVFKSKAGDIGPDRYWVCFYSCYMHDSPTLLGLLWSVITEFSSDKHLVG